MDNAYVWNNKVKYDLDTPCLILDLDVVEKNIQSMAENAQKLGVKLRPHAKIYKAAPFFAWMQLNAGAVGITVSKLTEAEILAAAGVKSILIANQVVGEQKVKRLVELNSYSEVIATVDCLENIRMINGIALAQNVVVGLLLEVDIGNNRCGAEPCVEAPELVREIVRLPGLKFRGLMGYDGHLVFAKDEVAKEAASREAYRILADLKTRLESDNIPVEIVSGSGSGTYTYACREKVLTELQVGTYIFSDTTYSEMLPEFECALTAMATVISKKGRPGFENMAVLNLGRKCISLAYGLPEKTCPEGEIISMPQEHCRIRFKNGGGDVKVGDKVEVWVRDANETFNLYDSVYLTKKGQVVAKLEIAGHGKVT